MCLTSEPTTLSSLCVIPLTSSWGLPMLHWVHSSCKTQLKQNLWMNIDCNDRKAAFSLIPFLDTPPTMSDSTLNHPPSASNSSAVWKHSLTEVWPSFTCFPRCFNLTEKCLEIDQTSNRQSDLHDRAPSRRKLIFREALWERDLLVALMPCRCNCESRAEVEWLWCPVRPPPPIPEFQRLTRTLD